MKLLIDTNILLDVALAREGRMEGSAALLDRLQDGIHDGHIAWHTLSNFYYILAGDLGGKKARHLIGELVGFLSVSPTTTEDTAKACALDFPDFEDALQAAAALRCGAEFIVTRNGKDFKKSPVPATTPEEILNF